MGIKIETAMGPECPVVTGRPMAYVRACPDEACRRARCQELKAADIEMLACLAARLAGRNPDRQTAVRMGEVVAFDDLAWRYPDFLARAEAAYRILASDDHPEQSEARARSQLGWSDFSGLRSGDRESPAG